MADGVFVLWEAQENRNFDNSFVLFAIWFAISSWDFLDFG